MYIHTHEYAERKIRKEIHGIINKERRQGEKDHFKTINIYSEFSGGSAVRTPHFTQRKQSQRSIKLKAGSWKGKENL